MNNELQTLSKMFTEKLFRIPDYQRGYAWTERHLLDYWSDLMQINETGNHYTGVLTLETVPAEIRKAWDDDRWIMDAKKFDPFYVVDGQQRLTTSIILIQCISEKLNSDEDSLNYTSKKEIQKKYLFDTKDNGMSRSYIFGYEEDNPSYEYLKTIIFNEKSPSDRKEETVYTNNLLFAKSFFLNFLDKMSTEELESVFTKVTQRLLFNIFTISEEVDVCVAFETMNNRGKPLSYLELLKNRLIYLSIKLEIDSGDSQQLRKTINESWKTIYHNLGRNKDFPLDDDFFLRCHHFINYLEPVSSDLPALEIARKERRLIMAIESPDYKDLLNDIFTFGSIIEDRKSNPNADLEASTRIREYSISLQEAVKMWHAIFNPKPTTDIANHNFWLAKINRLNNKSIYPVLLSIMLHTKSNDERTRAFQAIERLIFLQRIASVTYPISYTQVDILSGCINLHQNSINLADFVKSIESSSTSLSNSDWGKKQIKDAMRSRNFYSWRPVHYLLYEYNLDLQLRSKTNRDKIEWETYVDREDDYKSIEHIYPQNAHAQYWRDNFSNLKPPQRALLKNVIGNLLPLSKPKNSSLSNAPYPDKIKGKTHGVGYAYGSYAENEVITLYQNWNPAAILDRSLRLLDFMEHRWGISFGRDSDKIEMLGLSFVGLGRSTPRLHGSSDVSSNRHAPKKIVIRQKPA